ncbi:hypothetical protein PVAP13_9NG774734 [Panicum virgatum]|uniref:Uncharacterized protein n=1 Tax=Panicum virgatum TaxID=38727 RepID=A0A8T0N5D3_PANVG|nr:hypothetical protein PVAP13_9NG774734 [Panicum virgatum]
MTCRKPLFPAGAGAPPPLPAGAPHEEAGSEPRRVWAAAGRPEGLDGEAIAVAAPRAHPQQPNLGAMVAGDHGGAMVELGGRGGRRAPSGGAAAAVGGDPSGGGCGRGHSGQRRREGPRRVAAGIGRRRALAAPRGRRGAAQPEDGSTRGRPWGRSTRSAAAARPKGCRCGAARLGEPRGHGRRHGLDGRSRPDGREGMDKV